MLREGLHDCQQKGRNIGEKCRGRARKWVEGPRFTSVRLFICGGPEMAPALPSLCGARRFTSVRLFICGGPEMAPALPQPLRGPGRLDGQDFLLLLLGQLLDAVGEAVGGLLDLVVAAPLLV